MTPSAFRTYQNWPHLVQMAPLWTGLLHVDATPASVAKVASGLIYLATPYSLQVRDPADGRWSRWHSEQMAAQAARAAADLARLGRTAVSPIVQSAVMCQSGPGLDPLDERFWARWCQPMLDACRAVVVPDIPGWHQSLGVWREVIWALEHSVPVHVYGGAE